MPELNQTNENKGRECKDPDSFVTRRDLAEDLKTLKKEIVDELKEEFSRQVGAIIEQCKHDTKVVCEGFAMQIESSERRWLEQRSINESHDFRIKKLEVVHI